MKPLRRILKPYKTILIGVLSAVVIVSVGLFTNALLPQQDAGSVSNVEAASGISVTPLGAGQSNGQDNPAAGEPSAADRAIAPPPPLPSAATSPGSTAPKPQPPISQETIEEAAVPPSENYENYDDLSPTLYNHFAFKENDPARNESVGLFIREFYEREESLDYEAVDAFISMRAAAAAEGVDLMPISGFRTIEHQAELFKAQTEKLGSEAEAAKLSAPPGHSEHHTGYAIDIGDTNVPDADIKYSFQDTDAYLWLINNAAAYGFEESFPKGNLQGVSYEPWHWRYVKSARASDVFRDKRLHGTVMP